MNRGGVALNWSLHEDLQYNTAWWFQPTPLKNDGVSNSWDDEIPNWMESHKIPWFQTTKQIILEW